MDSLHSIIEHADRVCLALGVASMLWSWRDRRELERERRRREAAEREEHELLISHLTGESPDRRRMRWILGL